MSDSDSDSSSSSSSPSDNENNNEETHEDITEGEKTKIRGKLSSMSFEDLQKLKEKIGSKLYNQAVFGADSVKRKTFKRANKNRPREVTSKKRVKLENNILAVKKQELRDPRFDPLCGSYDSKIFKQNYKFINDLRKDEKKKLEKELQETKDVAKKQKIKFVVQRLDNQLREEEKLEKEQEKTTKEKVEIKEKLKKGEKPTFKRKSLKRLEGLIDKYEELKKTSKLQKHIERRSKKLSAKDRKKLERDKLI